MFIYILRSNLFLGQTRRVVSNFPLDIDKLYDMVNADNNYVDAQRWYLAEQY